MECGAASELLGLSAQPNLEAWLSAEGGLGGATPGGALGGAQVGPLTKRQAQLLQLLCRLYIQQGRRVGRAARRPGMRATARGGGGGGRERGGRSIPGARTLWGQHAVGAARCGRSVRLCQRP